MCGIWDWQSTIVKDLNDSHDPKHTLFCRENAFFAIYALFSDNKCPLFTRLGGGGLPKADIVCFFLHKGFPYSSWQLQKFARQSRPQPSAPVVKNLLSFNIHTPPPHLSSPSVHSKDILYKGSPKYVLPLQKQEKFKKELLHTSHSFSPVYCKDALV